MTGDVLTPGPEIVAALARAGVGDADAAPATRAAYSSDASLYRVVPQAVVRPRHADELDAILAVAVDLGVPLTMRGAGTSVAGNAIGPGLVVDTRAHLHRVIGVDREARTATVQPGVVHADLQAAARAHGLRYGPDPSTHPRCTIGGMIGNNACGTRALGYGRTSDTMVAADVRWPGARDSAAVEAALAAVAARRLALVRTEFGRFSRQVSGYALEHLLPERFAPAAFLAGSEGTLGLVAEATVALVPEEPRGLVVLGFASIAEAADAVPAVLAAAGDLDAELIACEGLDARLVEAVRGRGRAVPQLPPGGAWLFVEAAGSDRAALLEAAAHIAVAALHVEDAAHASALWRLREAGAGIAAGSLDRPAHAGWEDSAVPPDRLGEWIRALDVLLDRFGLDGICYGHFGEGCVHIRIDFDVNEGEPATRFRAFTEAAADAVAALGGSLSGEHGDGRARSELLARMYDSTSLELFAAVKHACDPAGVLNPGVLVDPAPIDADLRGPRPRMHLNAGLALAEDGGSLADAVHRCTGVGACVRPALPEVGSAMCPSFLATGRETDSTRGRARVLAEALDTGSDVLSGLGDDAVAEVLDLCLSCKACASDCPTGVDMATYKSEVLHQVHDVQGRRRPRSHRTLGRLPQWLRLGAPAARVTNRALTMPGAAAFAKRVAGVDPRRGLPELPERTLRRGAAGGAGPVDVWLWADTFTDHLAPEVGHAALRLLEDAGIRARVLDVRACCGLTYLTTGQLDRARREVSRTVAALAPIVQSGIPIVALEPSCGAALRGDAAQLDPRAAEVGAGVLTLAEYLTTAQTEGRYVLPDLTGVEVLAQPHCHQHAVLGWDADRSLLERAGATVNRVNGCCGLAGNFGMEQGHYETSVAVAETNLLPAVRAARPGTVVLADGFSCRTQLTDLVGVESQHLAQLLASAGDASHDGAMP